MADKSIKYWLKEGEQSKITEKIKEIVSKFSGNDFEKIMKILEWYNKNIKFKYNYESDTKIFASRTVDKIIKDGFSTGCHDDASVTAVLLRAVDIPTKYLVGINRITPDSRGHCVVEAYVNKKWVLIEPKIKIIFIEPSRSSFLRDNFVMEEGLDSWDCGVKTFKDWKNLSKKVVDSLNKLEKRK